MAECNWQEGRGDKILTTADRIIRTWHLTLAAGDGFTSATSWQATHSMLISKCTNESKRFRLVHQRSRK